MGLKAVVAAAAAVAATGVALGGVAAQGQGAVTAPGARAGVVRHAASPTLTPIGRSGLLLTATRANGALLARVAKRAASGEPRWGRAVRLGTTEQRYPPQVALNRRGVGAVAWSMRGRGGSLVRLRSAKGTWSPAYRIPSSFEPVESVSVNRRGVVAVLATARSAPSVLVTHRPGGSWQVHRLAGISRESSSAAVAPDGSVYVAGALVDRGGDGSAFWGRLAPGGGWTQRKLAGAKHGVEQAQVLVTPDGRVHVVVGRVGSWASTYDTEYYWATRFLVRTRAGAGGPWTTTWDQDGATDLSAQVSGNSLRMTWTQYADPTTDPETGEKVPQQFELRTGRVDQPGDTALAAEDAPASDFGGPGFASTTAASPTCTLVAWRAIAASRPGPLTASLDGARSTWPDSGKVAHQDPQAAAACVGGHGYLARTVHQVVRHGTAVGGRVRVERLS